MIKVWNLNQSRSVVDFTNAVDQDAYTQTRKRIISIRIKYVPSI